MAEGLFNPEQTLREIEDELMQNLKEDACVTINGNGRVSLYIPENGDVNFWFNDLIKTLLQKVANKDMEIVKVCIKNNIDLFDVSIKKKL